MSTRTGIRMSLWATCAVTNGLSLLNEPFILPLRVKDLRV